MIAEQKIVNQPSGTIAAGNFPGYLVNNYMNEKDQNVKAEILTRAQQLFGRFGLNKTTMEDIAKATGKGKSTIYYYYKSKEEIFNEVVITEMNEVFALTRQAVNRVHTAEEKLRAYALIKFRAIQHQENLYQVVQGEKKESNQHFLDLHKRYARMELNLVQNILQFGLADGEFAGFTAGNLQALTLTIVCAGRGLEMGILVDQGGQEVEDSILMLNKVLMRGLKG